MSAAHIGSSAYATSTVRTHAASLAAATSRALSATTVHVTLSPTLPPISTRRSCRCLGGCLGGYLGRCLGGCLGNGRAHTVTEWCGLRRLMFARRTRRQCLALAVTAQRGCTDLVLTPHRAQPHRATDSIAAVRGEIALVLTRAASRQRRARGVCKKVQRVRDVEACGTGGPGGAAPVGIQGGS